MISSVTEEYFTEREQKSPGGPLEVRKARMCDIAPILQLINGYAAKGVMLPRTELELSEHIRDFSVVLSGGRLLGCGALHFYSPTLGEIRSLAVDESAKTHGVGRRVVEHLVEEALEYDLDGVFAFTYVVEFFNKVGFHVVERGVLPLKAWKDCLRCPKFQCCDEIAVVRILNPRRWGEGNTHTWGHAEASDNLIQLPTVNSRAQ
jgi:amino-acid N-acetyltransferase